MGARQRGFTLIEVLVTVGILTLLLAAGAWSFSLHPNALVAATDDVDAALASARAIAASSGNGATLVFAPRGNGRGSRLAGFALRIYSGRPNAPGAVNPTSAMPVIADANVRERTLGTPPFSLFVDSAGDASAEASYPALDANGNARFAVIAQEPACPPGGFLLTFTNPRSGVSSTRSLACRVALSVPGGPNPSPTPNVPLVTPPALLFHWPQGEREQFVATEWGYVHWFAAPGFTCGNGVAAFPDVLPSPYSPAYSPAEAARSPSPPPAVPYSYPNANGASTNDAPATFPLQPQSAGLCSASVRDAYGQSASTSVAVMGWLTAAYGSAQATHANGAIAIPASALPRAGSSVTISLTKTFDAASLAPRIAFTGSSAAACTSDLAVVTAPGTAPATPSPTPATAAIALTVTLVPPSALDCTGIIYNHYADPRAPSDSVSESSEGVAFTASLAPATGPLSTLGKIVFWMSPGNGGACSYAQLYLRNGSLDTNAPNHTDASNATDANGCVTDHMVRLWATESNYTGAFSLSPGTCSGKVSFDPLNWPFNGDATATPAGATPGCAFAVASADQTIRNAGAQTVDAVVDSCQGSSMTVAIGTGCTVTIPNAGTTGSLDCTGGGSGGSETDTSVTWNPPLPALGTFDGTVWTRTEPGTQTVSWVSVTIACFFSGDHGVPRVVNTSHGGATFN